MDENLNEEELRQARSFLKYHKELKMAGRFMRGVSEVYFFVSWFADNGGKILKWLIFLSIPFVVREWSAIVEIFRAVAK